MRTVVAICVVAASAFTGPSVWAGLSFAFDPADIDQQQTGLNFVYAVGDVPSVPAVTTMAQTFTVGKPGTWYGIEIGVIDLNTQGDAKGLFFEPVSPPLVQIQGAQPGSTGLASVTLSDPDLSDGWIRGTLVSPIVVAPGQMYSIVLSALNSPGAVSVGAMADEDPLDSFVPASYPDGALWATDEVGAWRLLSNVDPDSEIPVFDMQFRTYVVPVPLPAGVWLGIFAVSVAGWHLKRQMA